MKEPLIRDATEQDGELELEHVGQDLYLTLKGVRIAKRGRPGTSQAGRWLEVPGSGIKVEHLLE